ncbi:hypothetical protein TNCV_4628981 [Trichonephila clavipes]|nr:hypothetical protein TNCV_4628981 [Trichonephila clavipes]
MSFYTNSSEKSCRTTGSVASKRSIRSPNSREEDEKHGAYRRRDLSNHCQWLATPEIIDLHTDTEQRIEDLLTQVLPHHHPLDIPRVRAFPSFEPKDVSSDYVEQVASKGKGAIIQALWTLYAKSSLYRLAYKAWKRHGPQNLTTWTLLAQAVLDGCYAEKWPDTVFQVPDVCSICPMHWPEKTHCGHGFHLQCVCCNTWT